MKLLAFDTSTETLSIAVQDGDRVWTHSGAGGAQASTTLIPAVLRLLADAGLPLSALDAIAFGRGPGSFTGLRTACAVAQGLGLGAGENTLLLPVDTLLAVAEEARHQHGLRKVVAMLDARMDEIYLTSYDFDSKESLLHGAPELFKPEAVQAAPGWTAAGNAHLAYGLRLPADLPQVMALPTATAMLRLAPALLAAGQAVRADEALPRYVRDKVASTTEERAAAKAAVEALRP